MVRGPRGENRPADAIGAAIRVAKLATGEAKEKLSRPNEAAALLGRLGGKARAEKLTAKKRSEIAKKAARARWENES